MGKLLNLLGFFFVLLFIAGVSWLGYNSFQHMKEQSALTNAQNIEEQPIDEMEDTTEWDEDEDLLEDDEVDELLAGDEDSEGIDNSSDDLDDITAESTIDVSSASNETAKEVATQTPSEFGKAINMSPNDLYMVISGSFTIAENAEKDAIAMQKKGYPNAETVQFASTKYLSVCTGRFSTKAEAQKMVDMLKKDLGIEAYVHKRRWK